MPVPWLVRLVSTKFSSTGETYSMTEWLVTDDNIQDCLPISRNITECLLGSIFVERVPTQ